MQSLNKPRSVLHLLVPGKTLALGPSRFRSPLPGSHSLEPQRNEVELGTSSETTLGNVQIDLFETAGTAEDRSATGWEPLGADVTSPGPLAALLSTMDFSEPASFDGEEKKEYDPLRDGPLRYLGYANELGEAFAAWLFAGGVPLSYAIAIGYVLFDTADKYRKILAEAQEKLGAKSFSASVDVKKLVGLIGFERGLDTLVWQLIASVAVPGYIIHSVVAVATSLLTGAETLPAVTSGIQAMATAVGVTPDLLFEILNKSLPTAAGLLAIPFIIHPIDAAVHALLNATLRPVMRNFICKNAGGAEAGLAVCKDCSSGPTADGK